MKTERNKPSYPLPEDYFNLTEALVRCDEHQYSLIRIRLEHLVKLRLGPDGDVLAKPVVMADDPHSRTLELWPTPADAYEIVVRYFPPEKVF